MEFAVTVWRLAVVLLGSRLLWFSPRRVCVLCHFASPMRLDGRPSHVIWPGTSPLCSPFAVFLSEVFVLLRFSTILACVPPSSRLHMVGVYGYTTVVLVCIFSAWGSSDLSCTVGCLINRFVLRQKHFYSCLLAVVYIWELCLFTIFWWLFG